MKDFPAYGVPRRRFFRWEMDFGYNWILTMPQIEIMQADLPHTLYRHDRKRDKGKRNGASGRSGRTVASDEVIRLQEGANRRFAERRAAQKAAKERGEIPYDNVDELFNQ